MIYIFTNMKSNKKWTTTSSVHYRRRRKYYLRRFVRPDVNGQMCRQQLQDALRLMEVTFRHVNTSIRTVFGEDVLTSKTPHQGNSFDQDPQRYRNPRYVFHGLRLKTQDKIVQKCQILAFSCRGNILQTI